MAKQNTSPIKTYPCGTIVRPKLLAVDAMITSSIERFGEVRYEVTFYDTNGDRHNDWMHESEFTTKSKKRPIGFKA